MPLSLERRGDAEMEWGVGVRGTEARAGPGGARAEASRLGGGRWAGEVRVWPGGLCQGAWDHRW